MTDLISFIESNWDLENVKVQVMQKNGEREVYLANSGEDSFVLKIFHSEQAKNSIMRYTDVLAFLTQSEVKYAPKIFKTLNGSYVAYKQDSPAYLMEYIKGNEIVENEDDEYRLGALLAQLHKLESCPIYSDVDTSRCTAAMLTRFGEYSFKAEYDNVVKSLPDFSVLKQSFIHTDVRPKNAIKRNNGEICLIDFDEAGIGSTYIDLGYPLITQFVQFVGRKEGGMVPDINKLEFHYIIKLQKRFMTDILV